MSSASLVVGFSLHYGGLNGSHPVSVAVFLETTKD